VLERQLTGNDRRARADTIVEHSEQIVAGALIEILKAPVVQQQDVQLGQLREPIFNSSNNATRTYSTENPCRQAF
jgi:hypothetical protein